MSNYIDVLSPFFIEKWCEMVRITSQIAIPLSTCGERLFAHEQLYPNHDNQLSEPGRKQSYEQADKGKADGPMKTGERKEERNFYTGDGVKTNRVMRQVRSKKKTQNPSLFNCTLKNIYI